MKILQEGIAPLLQEPDINAFREHNRTKPKRLIDKRMTEAEAVSRFIQDGDYIGTELYGTVRCPQSLVNEIVRQGKTDLRVAGQGVYELDILLAARLVSALDHTYIGMEVYGISNCLRREVESGRVETASIGAMPGSPGDLKPPRWVCPLSRCARCWAPIPSSTVLQRWLNALSRATPLPCCPP